MPTNEAMRMAGSGGWSPVPYDSAYGDDKICVCGHAYYRHFDTMERMAPVGCKYCQCAALTFKEAKPGDIIQALELRFELGEIAPMDGAALLAVAAAARAIADEWKAVMDSEPQADVFVMHRSRYERLRAELDKLPKEARHAD